MKYKSGEEFLNKLYSEMYKEYTVSRSAGKNKTPTDKISGYLKRLEEAHSTAKENEHKLQLLKHFYYDKYIIKELPDNYIAFRQRIAWERGLGDLKIDKKEMLARVQEGQKNSLDKWIDYFVSDETPYPMWFKNYAFRGMLKLSRMDKDTLSFGKRTKTTTEPFIELDSEILDEVYHTLANKIENKDLTELQKEALQNGENFGKIYAFYIEKHYHKGKKGVWVRYKKGSDYHKLEEDLQGKNTGWCTADEMSAMEQLIMGDFYVYYTKNEDGEYTVPRIAISMEDQMIVEVRGIKSDQGLEDEMIPIVSNKLSEFPDKNRYLKRALDMKKMTLLEKKQKNGKLFSKGDLKFLYEFERPILGFGMEQDPRIQEIRNQRNTKKDYAEMLNVDEKEISLVHSLEELESCSGKNIVYIGDLELDEADYEILKQEEKLQKIAVITGDAKCSTLTDASAFEKLSSINGDASFENVEDKKEPKNLRYVTKNAYFGKIKTAAGLHLLSIGGHASFDSLEDATEMNLQNVDGNLYLNVLEDSTGFKSLQNVGGDLYVPNLKKFVGFERLYNIGSIRQPIDGMELTSREFISQVKEEIRERDLAHMMNYIPSNNREKIDTK